MSTSSWRARLLRVTRPVLRFEAIAWIALASFIGYRIWPQVAAAFGVASANTEAPDVEVTTLDGQSLSMQQLRGQVVLVNFWATWCPPCRVEMPGFQRVYDSRRAQGFVVLGLSTDAAGAATVSAFLAERGITYPVAMARGDVAQRFGGANMLPTSYLVDRAGRIRHEVRGIFTAVALEQAVDRLLAEPAPAPLPDTQTGVARAAVAADAPVRTP